MSRRVERVSAAMLFAAALLLTGDEIPLYHSPAALAADAEGKTLYIADLTGRQVAVYDTARENVRARIALPDRPGGLVLSPDGSRLYVTNAEPQGKVHVINTWLGTLAGSISVGHTPGGPALSHDGRTLYLCNRFNNDVS